jgi:hypothetical protein
MVLVRLLSDYHPPIIMRPKYKEAYDILMEYWDSLPDEEKPDIHKRLLAVGV